MNRTKEFDLAQALREVQLGVLHLLIIVQDHLVQTLAQEVVVLLLQEAAVLAAALLRLHQEVAVLQKAEVLVEAVEDKK